MPDHDNEPLEPWAGYADLDAAERASCRPSTSGRKDRDQAYAVALAAAVGNYEMLRELVPDTADDERSRAPRAASTTKRDRGSRTISPPRAARTDRETTMRRPGRRRGVSRRPPCPPELDLREAWHEVADQGHTTSCVGWALADSVLRWQLVKSGRLAPDERLSARYVWMASKEFDERIKYPSTFLEEDGTSLKAGLDVVRKWGLPLERELPFSGNLAHGSPEDFNASATSRRSRPTSTSATTRVGPARLLRVAQVAAPARPVPVLLAVDRHLAQPGAS